MLAHHGYDVLPARTGTAGVDLALSAFPDLVLMDIQLPDVDGLEATKRIKSARPDTAIPIVALTSYAMPGDRERALASGCVGYIEKPINPDTFVGEIEKYLAGEHPVPV